VAPIEELYEKYYKDIYRFVLALSKDRDIAEDIAQETFMKAIKGIDKFKGDCDVKSWLCQIAKNTFYNDSKRRMRDSGNPEELENVPSDCDFVRDAIDSEEAMRIHQIVHNLKEPYKEVFNLRVFGELSYKQIARIYGKTESWARVTYHRAKVLILTEVVSSSI